MRPEFDSAFTIGRWAPEEFLARRADYVDLLRRSDADPLFLSWDWLAAWWETHHAPLGLSLEVFAAEGSDGRLLGVAPFTARDVPYPGGLRGTRLEPLGTTSATEPAAISEYITFPTDREVEPEVTRELVDAVLAWKGWDDMVLSFVPVESATWRQVVGRDQPSGIHVRPPKELVGYSVGLEDGFESFLQGLGPKTRLRAYNARTRLERLGSVDVVFADESNLESCLTILDGIHLERFGEPALAGPRGLHYRRMAERGARDGSLALGCLIVGGRPVAAAFNLREGSREYGIQLASTRDMSSKVSPGYLMLGYMIERASEEGVTTFDFLAGEAHDHDYRLHFKPEGVRMGFAQIVRNRRLAAGYRMVDLARRVIRL